MAVDPSDCCAEPLPEPPSEAGGPRALVIRTLRSIVCGLPHDFCPEAGALHDALCALLIGLASASVCGRRARALEPTGYHAPASTDPSALWVETLIGGSPLGALGGMAKQQVRAAFADYVAAWQHPKFTPLALGELNEVLLGHHPLQAEGVTLQLKPLGIWIDLQRLLDQAPPRRAVWLQTRACLSKAWIVKHARRLEEARTQEDLARLLATRQASKSAQAQKGQWFLQPSVDRRRHSAHYTPPELCTLVVRRTLAPLVQAITSSDALLGSSICDPAMGCGAFLLEAGEQLATQLQSLLRTEGITHSLRECRQRVASCCLYGVDRDPRAVQLAQLALEWWCESSALHLARRLKQGDALVGVDPHAASPGTSRTGPRHGALDELEPLPPGFDWVTEFPLVFRRPHNGFDACVGNPPWVSFVGRAAQPLSPALARYYRQNNPAFRQYKTLHGLFVVRGARLLKAGGRLGLVLPTSVADLQGYSATREAHDALCEVDDPLPDFGDGAFLGVFQPSMALLSTRRRAALPRALVPQVLAPDARDPSAELKPRNPSESKLVPRRALPKVCKAWSLERRDLNPSEASLLEKLERLPKMPPEVFGEWGFQTQAGDVALFDRREVAPQSTTPAASTARRQASSRAVGLHEGSDVSEFRLEPATLFVDPKAVAGRLRPPEQWQRVDLFVRQTARFPIAQRSDGHAFRNSLLACFARPPYTPTLLCVLLNSSLWRWFHYQRHRDARQGMPQLKIGHLRALPALIDTETPGVRQLVQWGAALATRNLGIRPQERSDIDQLLFIEYGLNHAERELVTGWAQTVVRPSPLLPLRTAKPLSPNPQAVPRRAAS